MKKIKKNILIKLIASAVLATGIISCSSELDSDAVTALSAVILSGENQNAQLPEDFIPGTTLPSGAGNNTTGTGESSASTASTVSEEITSYNSSKKIDIYSWSNSYVANVPSRNIETDAADVEMISFETTVYINLSTMQVSIDNSSWQTLSEAGSILSESSEITAKLEDGQITIDSSSANTVCFDITGETSKGAIKLVPNKKKQAKIYLHDAKINSSGNYPCLAVDSKSTAYLVIDGENNFADGRIFGTGYSESEGIDYYTKSYTGDTTDLELTAKWEKGADTKGSIYAKGALIVSGSGTLSLTENYKHGIYSKDYIKIQSGTINVNTTGRNAIQAVNGFVLNDGTILINGTGTHTNNESRGIIVEGSEDNPGEGYIIINGGKIDSTTVSKGISAKWDIDEDYAEYGTGTNDVSNDPYPYVFIKGGKINIRTTGTPQDESSRTYDIVDANGVTVSEKTKLSPEGIEGKQAVFISGGIITINATDDGINASCDKKGFAGQIVINGGNIYSYSSGNDAIDSNGNLYINGGIVVALTATTPECAFDCDQNTFAITGGLIAGIGTNNYSVPTASACSQSTIVLSSSYFGSAGTTFAIIDNYKNPVFAFTIPSIYKNSNYVMILSSPDIVPGTVYTALSAATATGDIFNNLYVNVNSATGGISTDSSIQTTESNYVYSKSSASNGGPQEGDHPNMGPGGFFPR